MSRQRTSGILAHITSLPSGGGTGDLGRGAYDFVDFLAQAGQSWWQVLPINPPGLASHHSPYSCTSAFAGNPILICEEKLMEGELLTAKQIGEKEHFADDKAEYEKSVDFKHRLFDLAFKNFKKLPLPYEYVKFCEQNINWLDDYALFTVLSSHFHNHSWDKWPHGLRDRDAGEIAAASGKFKEEIEKEQFIQYVFFQQWGKLKEYCGQREIHIIGDVPIYVDYNCADVWAHQQYFKLNDEKHPSFVAGVPPDYFSAKGQRWGNPVYNWAMLKKDNYRWWVERIGHNLRLFDAVRIDHFRGFEAYWEIAASEPTAIKGKWVEGPKDDLFNVLLRRFGYLPLIAEDLGVITADVRELMRKFDFSGMKVLEFAFGQTLPYSEYAPHNIDHDSVVYTGTHDNNTAQGWFEKELSAEDKKRFLAYIGKELTADEVPWELIRLAMMTRADIAIIPMQDILGIGTEGRMNTPSITEGNWRWRFAAKQITKELAVRLGEMTRLYGRC